MPLFSSRSARARRRSDSPGTTRRARRSAVVALGATTALVASGLPAAAAPFDLEYPTVFISQMLGGNVTTMRAAEQSREARGGIGGVEITSLPAGSASFAYNAVDYRPSNNYLYGVSANRQLVRIEHDGTARQLGTIDGLSDPMYSGAFGADPGILFARPTGSSNQLRLIDVDARTSEPLTLSRSVNMNDFTFSEGYLWGVEVRDIAGTVPAKWLMRIDPSTGAVTQIDVTAHFPTADDDGGLSRGYGAAWVYGNGNLAFSYNSTGNITQIRVANPTGTAPTVERVSTIAGPATDQNDGATSPSLPTNLTVEVTAPEPAAPGDPVSWTVEVENSGDAGSSGATFNFPVPDGVDLTDLDTGCTLEAGVVQCVVGQLTPGESDRYEFTGTAPSDPVSTGSTVTVIGNELDPDDNTAYLEIPAQPQVLTSTGVGTALQQRTIAVPEGGTLTLVDGDTPISSLVVDGVGTYAVSGSTVTFQPVLGFTGDAPVAPFRISVGTETGTGTYTATVTPPAAPAPGDLRTSGVSPTSQSATVAVPPSGSVTLLDADGHPVTTLMVSGGSYAIATSGVITFTPEARFTGEAPGAPFRVTDAYGQTGEAQYVPTVDAPAGPEASPYTSTGVGTEVQHPAVPVPVPTDGSVRLVGPDGLTVMVTVEDEGTYSVDPQSGQLSFAPVLGFVGEATSVTYRVADAYGQTDESTYTATVTAPGAPVATDRTSTGVGTQQQGTTISVPEDGTVALVGGDSPTRVVVDGEGTYELDPDTGVVTFTPVLGFRGEADGVTYQITDAYDQNAEATYTPTVIPPAPPVVPDADSTGPAVTPQATTITVPDGGTVALVGGDSPIRVAVDGQGTYELDPDTGVVTFTPVFGFSGQADPATVIVTDAYGQSRTGGYTPTVTPPPAPRPLPLTTEGVGTQGATVPVPDGGSVTLLEDGHATTSVVVPGQGTYSIDPATGEVTFAPVAGFTGEATPVEFRVTDAYGQSSTSTYTATVDPGPAAPRPTIPESPAPTPVTPATPGPATTATATPGPRLADTGVQFAPLLGGAAVLLLSGAMLLVASRRREQRV